MDVIKPYINGFKGHFTMRFDFIIKHFKFVET